MIADVFGAKASARTPAVEDMLRRTWQREVEGTPLLPRPTDQPRGRKRCPIVHQRRLAVASMWRDGMTEGEIGQRLGMDRSRVSFDVEQCRKEPDTYGDLPKRRKGRRKKGNAS